MRRDKKTASEETDATSPQNVVSTDPFQDIVGGWWNLEVERVVTENVSLFLEPGFNFGTAPGMSEDMDLWGVAGKGGARLYPFGEAPSGLFVQGDLSLGYVSVTQVSTGDSGDGTFGALSLQLGYGFLIADVAEISLSLGAGYYGLEVSAGEGADEVTYGESGILPTGRLGLGVAF